MISNLITRRDFSVSLTSFLSGLGMSGIALGSAGSPPTAQIPAGSEVSHTSEAIHQEIVFRASPKRVYETLTDTKQFNRVTMLSTAMKSGMPPGTTPTQISRELGGTFSLFGGHIVGRHLDLVPNERIVQAWRVVDWNPGVYSIVKFVLTEQDSGTKLVFDHAGFPDGKGQHLADGWKANYWEPLERYLA